MIPEGLEWKSAADILDDVASVGFNYIRMLDLPRYPRAWAARRYGYIFMRVQGLRHPDDR